MQQIDLSSYWSVNKPIPESLYIIGTLPPPEHKRIVIVGSRRPSHYGTMATKKIINELQGLPITIISGLALGIDALVHESALNVGLHTIALPGSGLSPKVLYPRTNTKLAERIVDQCGALLSQWETQPAAPWTFPVRNRTMAAIADMVIIIEATKDSGTMITARYATELGVPLGAVPGNIDTLLAQGPNMLLKTGAHCITSGEDISALLAITSTKKKSAQHGTSVLSHPLLTHLDGPQHKDTLCARSGLPMAELNAALMFLELAGSVHIDGAGIVHRMR